MLPPRILKISSVTTAQGHRGLNQDLQGYVKSLQFTEAAMGAQGGLMICPKSHSKLRTDWKLNLPGHAELVSDTMEESPSLSSLRKRLLAWLQVRIPTQGQELRRFPPHDASSPVQEQHNNAVAQRQLASPSRQLQGQGDMSHLLVMARSTSAASG